MTHAQRDTHVRCNPVALLQREWDRLKHCPRTLREVNSWGLSERPFFTLDEVLHAAGFFGAKCDSNADRVLAEIVRRAATDQLAARIALQRVLPPMLAIGRRRGKLHRMGFDEAFSLVLSYGWEMIRTYPIDRRPTKIAANIVRDIEYLAFVRRERRKPEQERLDERRDLIVDGFTTDARGIVLRRGETESELPAEELLNELLHEARAKDVSAKSLEVLEALRKQSVEQLADRYGVSPRTIREWRSDAVSELRERMLFVA
jgi:hypothetical protein